MVEQSEVPAVPDGIGVRGAAFWVAAQAGLSFDERESELLLEVCRTLDTIDLLAVAIGRDGVMLEGSQGQRVVNAAVAELRQQQAAYARLVTQLNMEGAEGAVMKSPRAASASLTAKRRWAQRSGGFDA